MAEAEALEWWPVTPDAVPDCFAQVPGGLRLGAGIVQNAAGCWRGRFRNRFALTPGERWSWIDERDHTAVARYRGRAFRSVTGAARPAWSLLEATCGEPACINPAHLDLIELPPPEHRPAGGGRWGWIGDGEAEVYGWIADPAPCETTAPQRSAAPRSVTPRSLGIKGEQHGRAKLTDADVRAIRAMANGDRRPGSKTSQAAIAARYGVSKVAVHKIIKRLSWAHLD